MRVRAALGWLLLILLLAPAVVVTVARLVQPDGERGVQLVSFTPLAMLPYAVALAALLVAAAVRRSRGPLLVALPVAAALGLHAWWFAPYVVGGNPPPAADATVVRVMTVNANVGEADGIELVRTAVDEDADVLVVEEVSPELLAEMDRAGLEAAFPSRIGRPGSTAHGTMVFSRFELGRAELVPTTWDSWLVPVAAPDGELSLLAVHPHAPTAIDRWHTDHHLVLHTVESEQPDLVVGDFNATPDHVPMQDLADAGFRSVSELADEGWQPTWPDNGLVGLLGLPLPRLVQIDHVLVGPDYAAVGSHLARVPGTDHRALVAEVAVK